MSNFPVIEMFCSIQGEGMYTGVPSIFVRVGGCNLRCVFGNSICDTPYSSFKCETPKWKTVDEAVTGFNNILYQNPAVRHVVITGGEPMLYKNALKEFIKKIQSSIELIVTIETNSTLPALIPWNEANEDADPGCECVYYVDMWSLSPKLQTSVDKDCRFLTADQRDHHDNIRINIDSITSYIKSALYTRQYTNEVNNIQLKFVYSGEESVVEIKQIIKSVYENLISDDNSVFAIPGVYDIFTCDADVYSYINSIICLMPEGTTNDQLNNIQEECAGVCIREGWKFCDRLHIRIWGDKRGV